MTGQAQDNLKAQTGQLVVRAATTGRLRSFLMESKEPISLLGGGASIKSGTPGAAKTAESIVRWAWCKENGRQTEDYSIRRSDYWLSLTAQLWFWNGVDPADLYREAVERLLGIKRGRLWFFEKLIPPYAYLW